jgi:hypothetical protein
LIQQFHWKANRNTNQIFYKKKWKHEGEPKKDNIEKATTRSSCQYLSAWLRIIKIVINE